VSAITGTVTYVGNGLHAMGLAAESPCVAEAATAPLLEKTAFLLDPSIFRKEVCTLSMKVLINRAFVYMFKFFSVLVHWKNGT
jgi:hypothetical protein